MAPVETMNLAERLDAAESRLAIADLIHGYARAMRERRPLDGAALFTEDGVFEIREGLPGRDDWLVRSRLEGQQAIIDYLTRGDASGAAVCPLIHNIMITLHGDSAEANCVMQTQVIGTSHSITGEYHDSVRRDGGRWLFSQRIFMIYGAPPPP
jgi:hypothetical protein